MPDPAAELLAGPQDCDAQCRRCHRPLTDAQSVGYSIGPVCRRRLGITGRRRVRLARVRYWAEVDGQEDLLTQLGEN